MTSENFRGAFRQLDDVRPICIATVTKEDEKFVLLRPTFARINILRRKDEGRKSGI